MNKTSALILIVLAIGIFYTFISPQYSDAQALATQASSYRSLVANVSQITQARDNLMSSYQAIPQTEKDRLMKVLPDSVDSVEIARELDTIASKYGFTVKSVTVSQDNPTATNAVPTVSNDSLPYDKTYVSFSFVSNYDNFVKFLDDLEKSLRIMDVQSASFQTGETGLYEHDITVETYWLK